MELSRPMSILESLGREKPQNTSKNVQFLYEIYILIK